VRLVLGADGGTSGAERVLVVDVSRAMPGRGAWLHPRMRCLELAERRQAFPRALRHRGALDTGDVRRYLESVAADG
jgi:hypothetical protein